MSTKEELRQLQAKHKELSDTVQTNCNPPDDCNDPEVLKTHMRECFEKAMMAD